MRKLAAILAELKRRRVFRVAVVYAGVAFIIFQVADFAFPALHVPDWFSGAVVVLLILGFPIAVGLAWAFDITEKGVVRAAAKGSEDTRAPRRPLIGNKTLAVVAALAILAAVWSWLKEPSPGASPITSIAVLPLDNLMGDPAQEYFVEGMHEALISALSRISALTVISRTSAMRYRDTDMLVPEIAEELGVDAIVEGSVLKAGDQVRITAQLIDGRTDKHLWTEKYDRDLRNILSLHSEVAQAIAEEIRVTLTPEEEAYLASARPVNPEAYDLYLRGWYFRTKGTAEGTQKTVDYLKQAVAIDPSFARAYALLVWGYHMLGHYGTISNEESRIKSKSMIERALELDDTLPDTYVYLGIYLYMYEWDWTRAELAFKRAIELDPNHVHARYEYGLFKGRMGRFEEALVEVRRAKELDPLSLQADYGIGEVYLVNRQYDKAIEQFKRILELDPGNSSTRWHLARVYFLKSMYAEALKEYKKLGDRTGIMCVYYAMGRETEALAYFDSLKVAGEQQEFGWSLGIAMFYSQLGDKEGFLNGLEKRYQERYPSMFAIKTFPEFDFLRDDPRFTDLLRRMNFPE